MVLYTPPGMGFNQIEDIVQEQEHDSAGSGKLSGQNGSEKDVPLFGYNCLY